MHTYAGTKDMFRTVVQNAIDGRREKLHQISRFLWGNPELALEEVKAHDYLTDFLESEGFSVQRNYLLPTAFRAEYRSPGGSEEVTTNGPTVAVMCEYDALPDIGHACGHNLIAECGVAAGIAIKEVLCKDPTLTGKVVVLGTPAEERYGGKELLIRRGAFDDVHVAMMAHPAQRDGLKYVFPATLQLTVRFTGKTAHAGASPWEGVNALDAAVMSYMSISLLRQQLKPSWRVSGVVIRGGKYANVIPEESELKYHIRAPNLVELKALLTKVESCFQSAGDSTGCDVHIEKATPYKNMINNITLIQVYQEHAEYLGVQFDDPDPNILLSTGASTDAGNVSQIVPCIHPTFKLNSAGHNHTREFQEAAGTDESQLPTLTVAKALALTAVQVIQDTDLLAKAQAEFHSSTAAVVDGAL
ncbi:xaa-Arg dipeptidase-like [Ornithodoros turicata]|uniref:xaa-Arg dipeptidase-like n=1 Tax=Ornithodoros turicata TaxID=34597 RepID=UPI003139506C